jgi:UDP-2-acetamido-2,6-beta-L-arabino-hexul-4-ose reductase
MKSIGITGKNGFVASHLYNTLRISENEIQIIDFERSFFLNNNILDAFVKKCDVIVHLAGMNRHDDPQVIYQTNLILSEKLKDSLIRTKSKAHVIFSSSSQEMQDNLYGKSKRYAREILTNWAKTSGGTFTGLIIPNVFGPFCNPYYNSVIATFCSQLINNEEPKILIDSEINLIYIDELVKLIIKSIDLKTGNEELKIAHSSTNKVSEILQILKRFKNDYIVNGTIPILASTFELNLFNTFRSYINYKNHFPVKYQQNTDSRGSFTEIIRINSGGQVSYSTTKVGITRGNHFHTRKIERFSVIKGKALIQLRKIGTKETYDFYLSGDQPAYVDMPIWYTHNIKNIGDDDLYTMFWINEFFISNDPDTYFENV